MCPIQLIVQYNPTNSCKIDGWIDGWQFLNPIPWNERTCRKLRNPWSRYTTLKWLVWNRPRRLYGLYSEVWMLEEQPSWQWQLWKGRWRCAWRSPSPRKTCWKTSPPRGWVPAIFAGRRGGLPTLLWDNELLNTKLEKQQLLLRWRKPCPLLRRSGAALPPAHFRSVLWRTTPGRKQVMNKLRKKRLMENDGLARFPRITMNMQIIQSGSGSMTSRGETRPENSWVKRTGVASVIMNAHHQLNLRTKVALWGISWVCMTTLNSLTLWPVNGWREPNLSDQNSLEKWSCCWKVHLPTEVWATVIPLEISKCLDLCGAGFAG